MFGRGFCCRLPEEHGKPAWIARQAVDFIDRQAGKPFALYVNFLEPHMPFFGPRDDQYDPNSIDLPVNHEAMPDDSYPQKYVEKSSRMVPDGFPAQSERTEADWRKVRARYYGLCSLVDTHAGKILDKLKESGQWDNTVVVFTSDHGDMMGSHAQTAKGVMYEEAVRVPMLIKMHAQASMKRVEGAMSHIDVMPTLLDLMKQDIPGEMQGKSLKAVMESDNPRLDEDIVIEWNNSSPDGQGPPKYKGKQNDERTLITPDGWKFAWSAEGKHLLFNHNDDPQEVTNLYGRDEHGARAADYMGRIRKWQKKHPA